MKTIISIGLIASILGLFILYDPDPLDNDEDFPNKHLAWEIAPDCGYAITSAPSGWAAWFAFRVEEITLIWKSVTGQPTDLKSAMAALEGIPVHKLPATALIGIKSFCLNANEIKH